MRVFWLGAGLMLVAIGTVGAFVPLLPTTIFMILAAGCFARSSPRLETWLLTHPRFGPTLRDWREQRAISRTGKRAALIGITFGYALFWLTARPDWAVALVVAALMFACAGWIASRREPASPR